MVCLVNYAREQRSLTPLVTVARPQRFVAREGRTRRALQRVQARSLRPDPASDARAAGYLGRSARTCTSPTAASARPASLSTAGSTRRGTARTCSDRNGAPRASRSGNSTGLANTATPPSGSTNSAPVALGEAVGQPPSNDEKQRQDERCDVEHHQPISPRRPPAATRSRGAAPFVELRRRSGLRARRPAASTCGRPPS